MQKDKKKDPKVTEYRCTACGAGTVSGAGACIHKCDWKPVK